MNVVETYPVIIMGIKVENMANKTLEQYLKDLRKSCNYSQEFVASHLNITRQTYSHYETGRITPPVNSLYNLAKLYGVPVENFLELVVTYNINMDFALKPQTKELDMNDDLSFSKQEVISVNHTKKNTPQGKRRLWLTKEAINILETAKSINPYGAFVFMPNDSLMLTDTFNRRLKKYTSEAGVPYYSSHKIRFTTASCLYNGKNLTQVSRALGHSQVSTTLHYFRNVENDEDLLEQMESAFSIK